jgi:hypothetical protein
MTEKTGITCDGCGATVSGGGKYVLVTFVAGSCPPYQSPKPDHHFCVLECLDLWRDREKRYAQIIAARSAKWRAEHPVSGPRDIYLPEALYSVWDVEARAEADRLFPKSAGRE